MRSDVVETVLVTVDFDYARRLVRDHLLDRWKAEDGRLVIAPLGFENATHWRVVASAEPTDPTDDEPPAAAPADLSGRAFLVDKSTGAVSEVSVAEVGGMTPYGP